MANNTLHRYGVHHYMALLGCLKRAHIEDDADGSDDADFGTNVHAWLNAFHLGLEWPEVSDVHPKAGCSEFELCSRYAERFYPEFLGDIILGERTLEGTLNGLPIRGTIDLVTRMDAATACEFTRRTEVVLEPGIYLHDFKTKTRHGATLVPELIGSNQATMYHTLLSQQRDIDGLEYFDTDVKGTLFHLLYRYKDHKPESFRSILVDRPDDTDHARLAGLIRDAHERVTRYGPGHMTPTRCYEWSRLCPLYGDCERYNG